MSCQSAGYKVLMRIVIVVRGISANSSSKSMCMSIAEAFYLKIRRVSHLRGNTTNPIRRDVLTFALQSSSSKIPTFAKAAGRWRPTCSGPMGGACQVFDEIT